WASQIRSPSHRVRWRDFSASSASLLVLLRHSLSSILFPYTTLFRSLFAIVVCALSWVMPAARCWGSSSYGSRSRSPRAQTGRCRSEEHTSELQSRGHLVCRLLLEKKKGAESGRIELVLQGHLAGPPH